MVDLGSWAVQPAEEPYGRNLTVFFSGHCRRSVWYHVREKMWAVKEALPARPDLQDWRVVHYGDAPTPQWSAAQMLRSRFCLCPAGDSSTSARLWSLPVGTLLVGTGGAEARGRSITQLPPVVTSVGSPRVPPPLHRRDPRCAPHTTVLLCQLFELYFW